MMRHPCNSGATKRTEEEQQSSPDATNKRSRLRIMISQLLFLLPPLLSAVAVSFSTIGLHSRKLAAFTYFLITSLSLYGIFHPPSSNAFLNYANGFFLSWYLVWSMNVLFIFDVRSLRRLQMRRVRGHDFCYWEPMCDTTGLRRLVWALDLSTNFRGLGWMSTSPGVPWPLAKYRWSSTTTQTFCRRLLRLIMDGLIFSGAQLLPDEPTGILLLDVLLAASALYSLMDGVHVVSSIFAVHILGCNILGVWGRSELYPQFFGELADLGYINLKAFWGRVWHDLLKGGLVSVSRKFVSAKSRSHEAVMQSALCFVLSAAIHAAATYSVSHSATDAFKVFVGFSTQILGIIVQQALISVVFPANATEQRPLMQATKKTLEAAVGIGWILLSLRAICMDPALRAAIRSTGQVLRTASFSP